MYDNIEFPISDIELFLHGFAGVHNYIFCFALVKFSVNRISGL